MPFCRGTVFTRFVDKFFYSPLYLFFLGVLTVLSNVFSYEIYVYSVFVLMGICICLFARDLLPVFPIFIFAYISPSFKNNPGESDDTVFSLSGGGKYLYIMIFLLVTCLVARLIFDKKFGGKKFFFKKRRLLSGMLILGTVYALSGFGSGQWEEFGWQNLLFALIQFASITLLYFLLSGGVRWSVAPRNYLAWTGIFAGYTVVAELINIYIVNSVIEEGEIIRHSIVTGWGHYNSIGALFVVLIPLPFFLVVKGRFINFAYFSSFVFLISLLFTCSRASILVGAVIYVVCYIISFFFSSRARRGCLIHIGAIALITVLLSEYREYVKLLFDDIIKGGFTSPERMKIYREGLKQFGRFKVFGGSFFPVDFWPYRWASADGFSKIAPPRWHNTVVQLLASGGIVSLVGYAVHRTQTFIMFFKRFSKEKFFLMMSVMALLVLSLFDCHFFNVGPVFLYSVTLAFIEFLPDETEKQVNVSKRGKFTARRTF